MAGSSDKPIPVPSPTGMWQDAHRQIPAVKDGDPVGYVAAMTPLERAARALSDHLRDRGLLITVNGQQQTVRLMLDTAPVDAVRAVLATIREPSEGMVHVGLKRQNYVRGCAAMFTAMIDAALAEGE